MLLNSSLFLFIKYSNISDLRLESRYDFYLISSSFTFNFHLILNLHVICTYYDLHHIGVNLDVDMAVTGFPFLGGCVHVDRRKRQRRRMSSGFTAHRPLTTN